MLNENPTPTPHTCQLPGCENAVEQPAGGGPRKRFCSDAHRVQYWRQSRSERGDTSRRQPTDAGPSSASPALALRSQLEQSVQSLEGALTRARTTLVELADLEEAEAIRLEAFSSADELVARASSERAAEERRRRAAESLAEAASRAAREAEEQTARSQAEAEHARAEVHQVRQEIAELKDEALGRIAAAHQRADEGIHASQQAAAAAHEEMQTARQVQSAAEAQAHQALEELEQTRAGLRAAIDRAAALEQRLELEGERHRAELATTATRVGVLEQRLDVEAERHRGELASTAERSERVQDRLERALAELRAETELRAKAEARAQAFEELKGERVGQRETAPPKPESTAKRRTRG